MVHRLLVPIALLALSACSLQQDVARRSDLAGASGGPAPALAGPGLDGGRVDLAAFRGHPVVIDFWASWCGPCRAEQGDINALAARYASRGVRFLGVDMHDDLAQARGFRSDHSVPYDSAVDHDQAIAAAWNVSAPPTVVLVDQQGRIISRTLGTVAGLDEAIDGLLARTG